MFSTYYSITLKCNWFPHCQISMWDTIGKYINTIEWLHFWGRWNYQAPIDNVCLMRETYWSRKIGFFLSHIFNQSCKFHSMFRLEWKWYFQNSQDWKIFSSLSQILVILSQEDICLSFRERMLKYHVSFRQFSFRVKLIV